jgi:Phytanoyl-CoA dioxygenase (PhyH)
MNASLNDAVKLRSLLPGVPLVESPFFEEISRGSSFDTETLRIAKALNEDGIAFFRFPDDEFDERAARIKARLAPRFDFSGWRARGGKSDGMRIGDAWRFDDDVRALAANARVLALLSAVYGRKAWPFQTLNFPVGSQQPCHSDSIALSSIPERFMCGVWLALEDISPDAGPLEYYPGSHSWPIIYNDKIGVRATGLTKSTQSHYDIIGPVWQALVEKAEVKPRYFLPKKGEAVIWAANLLHAGSRQRDLNVTRWSQVTHYFFENCCYITPIHSDFFIGKLKLRSLTNIATGEAVANIYIDTPLFKLGHRIGLLEAWTRNRLRPLASRLRNR